MKKTKNTLIWCVFCLCFTGLLLLPVRGEASIDAVCETVAGEVEDLAASLPPEVEELLPKDFFSGAAGEMAEGLAKLTDVENVLSLIGRWSGLVLRDCVSLLAVIFGILLLSAAVRGLGGAAGGGMSRPLTLCTGLVLCVSLLTLQRDGFLRIADFFEAIRGIAASLLPLMGALYAMGGNVGAAAANGAVMSAFLAILETLCSSTVVGVGGICLVLALPDALVGEGALRSLGGLIKRTYTLTLSFLMLLLCGVLGIQSTLSRAADTLALRSVRFAAGSFLPVVGGSVSESLRTVAGSVEYLRGVMGGAGLAVVFFAFLPTFLFVMLHRVTFLLAGAGAKLLGCDGEEKLLAELASVYGYFMAVIASLFVMLIFSLTLLAHCGAAVGG